MAEFHTIRVNQPSGWFYTSDALRTLCDIWDKHGSGLTNMHGSTGDIVFLGSHDRGARAALRRSDRGRLGPRRFRLRHADAELLRGPGALRVGLLRHPGRLLQHHPALPGRAAPAVLPLQVQVQVRRLPERLRGLDRPLRLLGHRHLEGRDPGRPDAKVAEYAKNGTDIQTEVCDLCPTRCMDWDGKTLDIDNANCVKCMHCINVMPKALKPGKERGATILIGGKAPIVGGALLSSVFVPSSRWTPSRTTRTSRSSPRRSGTSGASTARTVSASGEFIQRVGLANFLEEIGLDPVPEMVMHPRTNPYIFFDDEIFEDDDE